MKGVTGVILAGGTSSRMGSNKALLPYRGSRLIEGVYQSLSELFEEIVVITNTPEQYPFLPCPKAPDLYPGKGVLAGIHAALTWSRNDAVFVVACDMPHLNEELIKYMVSLFRGVDMLYPMSAGGFEPLHSLYGMGCLPALEELLHREGNRVIHLLSRVKVRELAPEEIVLFDPGFDSFININTPDDYYRLRSWEKLPQGLIQQCSND